MSCIRGICASTDGTWQNLTNRATSKSLWVDFANRPGRIWRTSACRHGKAASSPPGSKPYPNTVRRSILRSSLGQPSGWVLLIADSLGLKLALHLAEIWYSCRDCLQIFCQNGDVCVCVFALALAFTLHGLTIFKDLAAALPQVIPRLWQTRPHKAMPIQSDLVYKIWSDLIIT